MKNFRDSAFEIIDSLPVKDRTAAKAVLESWLEENYDMLIESFSGDITDSLDKKNLEFIAESQIELDGFHKRLFNTWATPLTRFSSLIAMCMEVGDEINREYRESGKYAISAKRNATTRIHARSVQIANEVACLARGGYADGAMARWRSLHEASVIIAVLSRNDEVLSDRFMDHQVVNRFKAATEYNNHQADLDFQSFDMKELDDMKSASDAMIDKYGKHFLSDYGWANEVLKSAKFSSNRPGFRDIENHVSLNFMRPYYGFASKNIHSGVDSIGYKLGLSMTQEDILLTGPSNEGLIDPIQLASFSLIFSTVELINTSPNDERTIIENVLWRWHEMLKLELVEAESQLRLRAGTDQDVRQFISRGN